MIALGCLFFMSGCSAFIDSPLQPAQGSTAPGVTPVFSVSPMPAAEAGQTGVPAEGGKTQGGDEKRRYFSYRLTSAQLQLESDVDLDGHTDTCTVTRQSDIPTLTLDMHANGILSCALTEYEYGAFVKILSADLTGDGYPEILFLADMGGNGAAGGSCALYGFTRTDGQWHAMEFPFLEMGGILPDHSFDGRFIGEGVISVHCMPSDITVDVIRQEETDLGEQAFELTYQSLGLTDVAIETRDGRGAYDLLLLQEVRSQDGSQIAGNGITQYSFSGGAWERVTQRFQFPSPFERG